KYCGSPWTQDEKTAALAGLLLCDKHTSHACLPEEKRPINIQTMLEARCKGRYFIIAARALGLDRVLRKVRGAVLTPSSLRRHSCPRHLLLCHRPLLPLRRPALLERGHRRLRSDQHDLNRGILNVFYSWSMVRRVSRQRQ